MPAKVNWTEELENAVIDWIASGKTLRSFGRVEGNPSHDAVYNHEKVCESFRQRIAHAREMGHDVIAEECMEISDDDSQDILVDADGNIRENKEFVNRSKLKIWTRLQLLAKWNPRKYGERIEHTGEIGIKTILLPAAHREALPRPEREPEFDELE